MERQIRRRRDAEVLGQVAGCVRAGRKIGMFFRATGHRVVFKEWKCSVPSARCVQYRSTLRESPESTGTESTGSLLPIIYTLSSQWIISRNYLYMSVKISVHTSVRFAFQLIPKLNANIMSEIERILDNKPSRPPMISTLALRWQSMCPHGSGGGSLEEAGSPKSEGGNSQDQEQTKEVNNKLPFCEIQWNADGNVHLVAPILSSPRTDGSTTCSSQSIRSRRTSRTPARTYDARVDDNTYQLRE